MGTWCDRGTPTASLRFERAGPFLGGADTSRDITLRRYELWRAFHEEGCRMPGGEVRKLKVREIARLFRVAPSAVSKGIRTAREEREAVRRVIEESEAC